MKRATCLAVVALAVLAGTWLLGWWAVPAVALVAGLLGCGPALVSAASSSAWLLLLLLDAAAGNVSRVATALAGIMSVPAAALFLITLALPALLGWSAATLGAAARARRATSRQPS